MDLSDILFLLIIVAILGIVVFGVFISGRWRKRRWFGPLQESLGLEPSGNDRMEGTWQGAKVHIRYEPGGRHETECLTFVLEPVQALPVQGFIRVRRKHFIDRLAVASGLARRLWKARYNASGKAFVEAANDDYAERVVGDALFRRAVLPLVDYFRPSLEIHPGRVEFALRGPFLRAGRKLKPKHVQRLLDRLKTISELEFPEPGPQSAPAADDQAALAAGEGLVGGNSEAREFRAAIARLPASVRTLSYLVCGFMVIGPVLWWWSFNYPALEWTPYQYGVAIGLGLCIVYGVLLFPWLRGQSRALKQFSNLMVMALIGLPSLAVGGLLTANAVLDHEDAVYHPARVVSTDDDSVALAVALPAGTTEVRIRYRNIEGNPSKDDAFEVGIRSGALGFPWAYHAWRANP